MGKFLDEDISNSERNHILSKTIPRIVNRAKSLKIHKPPQGLHFSLQQQGNYYNLNIYLIYIPNLIKIIKF